jgi:mannose-1-phosphate guanylyltransferase
MTGDERLKQFWAVIGDQTLLQQTRCRVSRMIAPERTVLVMNGVHKRFYEDQVVNMRPSRLLTQPRNRGTAAAILYSLMQIRELDSHGLVAFFPSDHYFANDDAFVSQIDLAFSLSESHPKFVTLLGSVPEAPEVAYGWIEPGPQG